MSKFDEKDILNRLNDVFCKANKDPKTKAIVNIKPMSIEPDDMIISYEALWLAVMIQFKSEQKPLVISVDEFDEFIKIILDFRKTLKDDLSLI